MTMMNLISHGTQDMYPTFLKSERGLDPRTVATIAIIYNIGALIGGLCFRLALGSIWDGGARWSRRRWPVLLIVPFWVYPQSLVWLTAGAFLMQFMVQGAWGAIPAHLVELSPPEVRGLFSGLAYQLGVLFAANAAYVEALIAQRSRLRHGAGAGRLDGLAGDAIVIALGSERKGSDLHAA